MGDRTLLLAGLSLFAAFATAAVAADPALEKDTIPTSGGDLDVTFVGHGSLFLGFAGKVIHVDPFGKLAGCAKLPKAGLVLITHAHDGDHLDDTALAAIRKPDTRILESSFHVLTRLLGVPCCALDGIRDGGTEDAFHSRPSSRPTAMLVPFDRPVIESLDPCATSSLPPPSAPGPRPPG